MCYLSSIDLSDAFWQVELRETDRDKTSFTVPGRGFFRFKRMPFGLVNSASTLSRIVDQIVGDLEPHVFPYLDDFIIASESFEHHLKIIAEVAKRLKGAGLTVSREKSKFCRRQLAYVGTWGICWTKMGVVQTRRKRKLWWISHDQPDQLSSSK